MFYHLDGKVAELGQGMAVIDCNGVGYLVNTSLTTQSRLKVGERSKLYISESVREDAFELFGFASMGWICAESVAVLRTGLIGG